MKRSLCLCLFFGIAFALIFNSRAIASRDLYDDFSNTYIDSQRWNEGEFVRVVTVGKLISKVGNHPAANYARNGTAFQNPSTINTIKCDIIVSVTNLDTGTDPTSVARVDGRFYNTLNSGTEKGDIWVGLFIGDRGSGLEAWWEVHESLDDEGNTWDEKGNGTLNVPGLTYGNPYTVKIEYDGANGFTFTVAGVSDSFIGPGRGGVEFTEYKALETLATSDGGLGIGYTSASFDNVYINNRATAYDTFDIAPLNRTNWKQLEFVREIKDGRLRLAAHSDGDTENTRLHFAEFKPYVEATITVKSDSRINSGAKGRVRIDGFFYNDTYHPSEYSGNEGNVWAQVYIDYYDSGTLEAKCYAERVMNPDWSQWQEIFYQRFTTPIILDRPYTLSILFTGTKFIFTCKDTVTEMEESIESQITTPAYQPSVNSSELVSRLYGNGSSGYMAVEFDDVYVGESVRAMPWIPLLLLDD